MEATCEKTHRVKTGFDRLRFPVTDNLPGNQCRKTISSTKWVGNQSVVSSKMAYFEHENRRKLVFLETTIIRTAAWFCQPVSGV